MAHGVDLTTPFRVNMNEKKIFIRPIINRVLLYLNDENLLLPIIRNNIKTNNIPLGTWNDAGNISIRKKKTQINLFPILLFIIITLFNNFLKNQITNMRPISRT